MTSLETESSDDGIISIMTGQLFFFWSEHVVHNENIKQLLITAYIYLLLFRPDKVLFGSELRLVENFWG